MAGLILHVEDREEDVFLLKFAFKTAEITNPVHVAADGQLAIDYLAGNGEFSNRQLHPLPLITLLDIQLPFKTGLDVLEWVREQPALKSLIIVMLTSSAYDHDICRAYNLGANGFLVKPSGTPALADMCRALKHYWLVHNQPPVSHSLATQPDPRG